MGITISIVNTEIGDEANVFENVTIARDIDTPVDIVIEDTKIFGHAVVLKNLKIQAVLEELERKTQKMNDFSEEYYAVKEILKRDQWNTEDFIKCVKKHLASFSQGILASVLANYLTAKW